MPAQEGDILAINTQGLIYQCPPVPALDTIRRTSEDPAEQVYKRDERYLQWKWSTKRFVKGVELEELIPEDKWLPDQKEWYYDEIRRLHFGSWIMIAGEPVYFNKYAHFFHQWFVLRGQTPPGLLELRPTFKQASLEYFRFFELCEDDRFCLGDIGIKGRRFGLSSMSASIKLLVGILESDTISGIVSKTGTDAQEMYFMIKHGIQKLPLFLSPQIGDVNDSEVFIGKKQRVTKDNPFLSGDNGKNNRINYRDTSETAYDGGALRHITIDECMAPETKIMVDGFVFKEIKDINIGDYVIVEGGKRVRVAKKFTGKDEMFLIKQPYSQDYVVSSKHRLYLEQRANVNTVKGDGIQYHTPVDFINLGAYKKRTTFGLRSSGIDFKSDREMLIDPYIFGAWLGDGLHATPSFVCNFVDEPEMLTELVDYGTKEGYTVTVNTVNNSKKAVIVYFTYPQQKNNNGNPFVRELRRLGVFKNKHIPKEYLHNSRESRLKMLAGIIDTDGHSAKKGKNGAIEIAMSRLGLIEDIRYLALSLGFSVSKIKYALSNLNTDTYKISISGDLSNLPMKVERKKFVGYKKQYAFRRNRIEVHPLGVGDYVGIQVESETDDDRRLILEDFTLTMNCAKWVKANVKTFFNKVSETLVVGATIVGKLSLFSTVDEGDKGGDNFRELWDGSDHIDGKKDAYGRTKTKLKRFFLPAFHGYLGYIGKYGESIIENPTLQQVEWLKTHEYWNPVSKKWEKCPDPNIGAKQWLQVTRDMLAGDPESLANEIRKNPFEWKEVFRGANNQCNFNLEELNDQIEKIESMLLGTGKKENGRRVRFTSPDSFVDDPQGIWYILQLPKQINKHVYRNGVKCPDNTDYGAAGMDTYANARSTVDKGSNACVIIHSRYDALDPENSDEPVAMLLGRPSTKGEFHNQVFWGLQYYGVQLLAERSPTDWEDFAIEHGLASKLDAPKRYGYLAVTKRSNDTEVYGVAPQDKQQREQHLTEMKEYANHKIYKIKFLALLKSMIPFDIDERTDYDECMAWGYALMCLKGHIKKLPPKTENKLTILKVFRKSA